MVFFRLKFLVVFLVVLLSFFCFLGSFPDVSAAGEADASTVVAQARSFVVSCYVAVADADKAGANVSDLLVVLNNASDLLSEADLAFLKGDFDSAADLASRSREMLYGFVNEAAVMRENAGARGFWDFMVNVVGSILGTVVVVVCSFGVWVLLKRKYGYGGSVSDGS